MTPESATYFLKLHNINAIIAPRSLSMSAEDGACLMQTAVLVTDMCTPPPHWAMTVSTRHHDGIRMQSLDVDLLERALRLLQCEEVDDSGRDIDAIQSERGKRYGGFDSNATLCQELKDAIRRADAENDHRLSPAQLEALDMAVHKIARIVNGDPRYLDSWIDAESYLNLGRKWTESNGGY